MGGGRQAGAARACRVPARGEELGRGTILRPALMAIAFGLSSPSVSGQVASEYAKRVVRLLVGHAAGRWQLPPCSAYLGDVGLKEADSEVSPLRLSGVVAESQSIGLSCESLTARESWPQALSKGRLPIEFRHASFMCPSVSGASVS